MHSKILTNAQQSFGTLLEKLLPAYSLLKLVTLLLPFEGDQIVRMPGYFLP
jgi:hypothetical protein